MRPKKPGANEIGELSPFSIAIYCAVNEQESSQRSISCLNEGVFTRDLGSEPKNRKIKPKIRISARARISLFDIGELDSC